jgi:hypothetical protein
VQSRRGTDLGLVPGDVSPRHFHRSQLRHTLASSADITGREVDTQALCTLDIPDPVTKQVVDDRGSYGTTYRKTADGSRNMK